MRLTLAQARELGIDVDNLPPDKPMQIVLPEEAAPPSRFVDDGMNKTERRFSGVLEYMKRLGEIHDWEFEPERLRLANRTFLKVDFRIVLASGQVAFVEVKGGFIRDDAIVKLKVAAESHPYPFFLAQLERQKWEISRLPSRKWGWINVDIQWRS